MASIHVSVSKLGFGDNDKNLHNFSVTTVMIFVIER